MSIDCIAEAIRDVPDFPEPGIVFKDITPVLQDPGLLRSAIRIFVDRHRDTRIDKVAGIEARGFIFGAPVAHELGVGFVPVRKKGKLPAETIAQSYGLEYGEDAVEIHTDAIGEGERILLIDDLLATGGTAAAATHLIEQLGGEVVEIDFLIELGFLHGRDKIEQYPIFAPIVF